MNDFTDDEVQILAPNPSLVQALTRAEIDQQIATAHQYPRSFSRALKRINDLASLNEATAESCMYALKRGGKIINGPSIRLAEIVFSQWGNCRAGGRVVHVDKKEMYVEAEGVFHDLETNAAITKRVRRNIRDKNGRVYNDDMITVTGNAAISISLRNAILAGVPRPIWGSAYEQVVNTIRGDVKTLAERRSRALEVMANMGLTDTHVFALLGVDGVEDISLDHMATLQGMRSAIKNEETTIEELLAEAQTVQATVQDARKPGHIAATTQIKGQPNQAADAAIEKEAQRVAQARSDEEAAKTKAQAELDALRGVYESVTGSKPDGRWNADTLQEKIKEAQAGADDTPAEDDQPVEEEPAQEEEPEPQADPDPAPSMPGTYDPETGEIVDDDPLGINDDAPPVAASSNQDWQKVYDDILNDLLDAPDGAAIQEMYSEQIAGMAAGAPDLHERLMAEINDL